jgi:hypothetical protein
MEDMLTTLRISSLVLNLTSLILTIVVLLAVLFQIRNRSSITWQITLPGAPGQPEKTVMVEQVAEKEPPGVSCGHCGGA